MSKIIRYELYRMICSKIFAGMACILLWYGWQVLNKETILGAAYTAPFSPWSFGSYLSGLMPMLSLTLMFFLWEVCSGQAKRVEVLADATLLGHGKLMAAKGFAAALAWLVLTLGLSLMGIGFLVTLFGEAVPLKEYMVVILLEVFPVLLWFMGVGLLASRFHGRLLFLIAPITVLFAAAPLPMELQLFSKDFFSVWPAGQGLDPAFSVPVSVVLGRLLYGGIGMIGVAASVRLPLRILLFTEDLRRNRSLSQ